MATKQARFFSVTRNGEFVESFATPELATTFIDEISDYLKEQGWTIQSRAPYAGFHAQKYGGVAHLEYAIRVNRILA